MGKNTLLVTLALALLLTGCAQPVAPPNTDRWTDG
jgi:hypothetical protein